MPTTDDRRLFQIALSYRQKANAAGETRAARRHIRLAATCLADLRAKQQARVRRLERDIVGEEKHQSTIGYRLAAGEVTPGKANDENRAVVARLAQLQDEAAESRLLMRAELPEQIGGFEDRDLDAYAAEFPTITPPLSRYAVALQLAIAVLAIVGVFLPWLTVSRDVYSLFAVPRLMAQLGAIPSTLASAIGWAGIALVFPPLLAMVAMRRGQESGWGLMLLGLTMAWFGALPIGALISHLPALRAPVLLWRAVQLGPILYCGAGVLLFLLGAQRIRSTRGTIRTALVGGALLAGWVVALGLATALPLLFATAMSVRFDASVQDAANGVIEVDCTNTGRQNATVRLAASVDDADSVFPIDAAVYVLEQGGADFRAVADASGCWSIRAGVGGGQSSVTLASRETQRFLFDARRLQDSGLRAQRVRLVFTRPSGQELFRYEADLPARFATSGEPPDSSARGVPRPKPESRASVPAGTTTPNLPMPIAPSAGTLTAEPAVSPPQPSKATVDVPKGLVVHYAGRVGDRVSLTVTESHGGPTQQTLVDVGSVIGMGWSVSEIHARPAEVVFSNQASNHTITLTRGQTVTLP